MTTINSQTTVIALSDIKNNSDFFKITIKSEYGYDIEELCESIDQTKQAVCLYFGKELGYMIFQKLLTYQTADIIKLCVQFSDKIDQEKLRKTIPEKDEKDERKADIIALSIVAFLIVCFIISNLNP